MRYAIMLSFLLLSSCYVDVKDIYISGRIIEKDTRKPIENADIFLNCWQYGDTPDGSYTNKDSLHVKTDKFGNFKVNFPVGAYVELKILADGYIESHQELYIESKNNDIEVKLDVK